MKKISVSVNHKEWDDIQMVKLVNKAGNCNCDIEIIIEKEHINMKNIKNMMEFLERINLLKKINICLDGEDEEEAASCLENYFAN